MQSNQHSDSKPQKSILKKWNWSKLPIKRVNTIQPKLTKKVKQVHNESDGTIVEEKEAKVPSVVDA